MQQQVSKIYFAESEHFQGTMTCHNKNVGFRIPEYQRTYDWNEDNIKRLLEDCLNRFYNLSTSNDDSYTFLGTLILVKEECESSFAGTSLSVVDGQQRLITLILLCCALTEELSLQKDNPNSLQELTISWINKEIEFILKRLYDCVIGKLHSNGQKSGFPRVVRFPVDNRAFSSSEAKYHSVIAKFLHDFDRYYSQQDNSPFTPIQTNEDAETLRFFQNYEYIKKIVELGIYRDNYTSATEDDSELDFNQIHHDDFRNAGLCNLFKKLDTLSDQAERDTVISDITNNSDSSGLIRLMLFSHYVLKSVVLTRIETSDEDAAFDIFDSLNTTGEPLSAIETFKPLVIRFESKIGKISFSKTESGRHFEKLEESFVSLENDKRQKETKELLVTFALFMEGYKLPENLADQRIYLRARFERAENPNLKHRFVQSLADIAEFRQTYWNRDFIRTLDSIHSNDRSDWLKLCCGFITDMKTSLALPIMARYWTQYQQDENEDTFTDAVKALTAFLVLRRSITGTTGGIDTDFRKMMRTLCIGLDYSNSLHSLDELKEMLKKYLVASRIGVDNKETWVSQVCEVPLARHAKPLCRFLLFAASDNSRTDQGNPGLLTREEDAIHSDKLSFLNFSKWQDVKYATVEHVAPDSNSSGWDEKIYSSPHSRHTIGNIILLPQKENSSIGNAPWTKKMLFYRALAAKTEEERKSYIEEAKNQALIFPKRTEDLLKKQVRLDMLEPIAEVSDWTKGLIQKRAENILQLAWDVIAPWLDYE
ncbi:MAG: DUF262 domain-containing HNH endonuclease family protein [Candidatus Poribacteria bacterium]|nr:DUF262 domain-containing HNH endonuclease family protein [Candidatus Poribacteria bacterium]